ncbi:MAG: hypothetical protein SVV80_02560 [Planctomycetota bacterium]|nr:hypothetical protein [Planctomycetota bacterium]
MEYVIIFVLGSVISWISLMIVIPIAQKWAEFSMPPWPETMWKLAVVSACGNAVAMCLDPINGFLSWIVGAVVFWTFMVKWFDVDFFGAIVIVIISWVLRVVLGGVLIGILMSAFAAM